MLLIDGVKYLEWAIPNEDDLEQMVLEHAQGIFGDNAIYFDKRQKLRTLSGVGSIPDGLVITLSGAPEWHIVEVELSTHDVYAHVVPQIDKFLNGVDNSATRNRIIEALYESVLNDDFLRAKVRQALGPDKELHKFLADLIKSPPTLTIVIERDTEQLREALRKYPQTKVVEFQTYRREQAETVHAHLFKPLFEPTVADKQQVFPPSPPLPPPAGGHARKVTAGDFTYRTSGVFALTSDPSVTIDIKKRLRIVEKQLAMHGLWNKHLYGVYFQLRKKAGLLNTQTED